MEVWKKDARNEVMFVDIEGLVLPNHLQEEINEERKKLGKDDIDDDEPKSGTGYAKNATQ